MLDFATSQVAMGKVRVANNKKVAMDEGLNDPPAVPTTDRRDVQPPYGAILPFGLHKGGGLAVICEYLDSEHKAASTYRARAASAGWRSAAGDRRRAPMPRS